MNRWQRLVNRGGRLVKHARYYWLLLAESHLTRRLFGAMGGADRVAALARGVEFATGRRKPGKQAEGW